MKKRIYRRIPVKQFEGASIRPEDVGSRLIVAVDVAKVDMVAALVAADGTVLKTICWEAPAENAFVIELLQRFRARGFDVEVVMEPSGTYGDVLRQMLEDAGFALFQVQGKKTHDASEVYDGVPSMHDAKAAAVIAKLHREGLSRRLAPEPDEKRVLRAAIAIMDLHQTRYLSLVHQLESWLARFWPELPTLIELTSASLLALLARIGGPADVARAPDDSRTLLRGISHGLMKQDTIDAVVSSASRTLGVRMLPMERQALMAIAEQAHQALRAFKSAKLELERLSQDGPAKALAPVVGKTTAAVIVCEVGAPERFGSAGAFVKAMGLNLKERSSGKTKGQLKVTKRGPSRVRQFLWLAVHRWIQEDVIARAWYDRKRMRDGGRSSRAAVALMRKLAKALYHVGRGHTFDSSKLFDIRRLGLAT